MPPPPPPPRLHVLWRPAASRAVVLRQGPSKVFCTIDWTLASDAFRVGQWCKHKIYVQRADLSADGQWMIYFALNGRWRSETKGAFTVLSRAPYLKAVRLWPHGNTWGGSPVFYQDSELATPLLQGLWDHMRVIDPRTRLGGGLPPDRLLRDGWVHASKAKADAGGKAFEKAFGAGWVLRKKMVDHKEHHQLRAPDGTLRALPDWEWAEVDAPRQRLVWSAGGLLQAAPLSAPDTAHVLFDARGMTFEPLVAPYQDETIIESE